MFIKAADPGMCPALGNHVHHTDYVLVSEVCSDMESGMVLFLTSLLLISL